MYRLRQMDLDDKVCEQVSMTLLEQVYPKAVIERCLEHSQPWASKERRVRGSTGLARGAVCDRIGVVEPTEPMPGVAQTGGQARVALHPAEPDSGLTASGLSGRRKHLGSECLQALLRERCQLLAQPQQMPSAFFGRYRLMGIDGSVFNTADTQANEQADAAQQQSLWQRSLSAGALCEARASVAAMRWSDSRWIAMMSPKCMGPTSCFLRLAQTCW